MLETLFPPIEIPLAEAFAPSAIAELACASALSPIATVTISFALERRPIATDASPSPLASAP